MRRPALEVADIFHRHGGAWRRAKAGHVSLGQLKVMAAIESCRTAALGGHVERCEDCDHTRIAYNSCRNRHCPRCQGAAARTWLAERQAELLPVGYFHLVFTLPAEIAEIAYQNKAVVYDLLFKASSEALLTIAADPKHLGARIGLTAVLHTWGSAMTHHPHVHMIVPGGGLSLASGEEGASPTGAQDSERWVACRPGFLLPVRVLSRLFRRLMLSRLADAHAAGRLAFFGDLAPLHDPEAFAAHLKPLRNKNWFVYAKRPFAGPEAVLAYLSRYTHRVAISNSRLIALDNRGVTFRVKDYRRNGRERIRSMTLDPGEFIRRFLLHVLPKGFHRIRHYGLLASAGRKANIAKAREPPCRYSAAAGTGGNPRYHHRHANRPSPAVSPVRRTHGHYRDLRAPIHTRSSATRPSGLGANSQDRSAMTGTAISQRHLTAGGQTSRQPNRCARSSFRYSRRPPRTPQSDHRARHHCPDRHARHQLSARRSQYHLRSRHPRPRADQATPEKSP